jgi:hypothetical protein
MASGWPARGDDGERLRLALFSEQKSLSPRRACRCCRATAQSIGAEEAQPGGRSAGPSVGDGRRLNPHDLERQG